MLMILTRTPRPDAAYWPGRRLLGAVDAVVWPALVCVVVWRSPFPTQLVGDLAIALSVCAATARLMRAIWRNERYRFTTIRIASVGGVLLGIGMVMKVLA